jgi:hypothetical protein
VLISVVIIPRGCIEVPIRSQMTTRTDGVRGIVVVDNEEGATVWTRIARRRVFIVIVLIVLFADRR